MDDGFQMECSTRGGFFKGFSRAMAGESMFLTTYTSPRANAQIAFGSSFPGCILPLEMDGVHSFIIQKHAFLASQESVTLSTFFHKKLGTGFFGGEGFILQKLGGSGIAFLEIDGDIVEKRLADGEVLQVDQGYIAGFDETVTFGITTVKGLKNKFFSGEGAFLATLKGPGRVWLQTMPFSILADRILSLVPKN